MSVLPTPAEARNLVRNASCWVLTDGKAGDEAQCLGVAERLGLEPAIRRVAPRPPFSWLMPWGGIDPRERPGAATSPIALPSPDIAIASGRRAAASLRLVKRASGGRTFTVFLKDPRSGPATADFLWVPEHDRLRGANVLATLTSPHRISPERLQAARENPPYGLGASRAPRVALIIGGDSQHHHYSEDDSMRLVNQVAELAGSGAFLMATASRRTPPPLAAMLRDVILRAGGYFWDGTGENPYVALLALADTVLATADSVNMVGEAVATGKPVLLFTPSGGTAKITQFLRGLEQKGAIAPFVGRLEDLKYDAIDSTPLIAADLARRFSAHRKTLQSR